MNEVGLTIAGSFVWNDGYGRVTSQIALGALERGWDVYLKDINDRETTKRFGHRFLSENFAAFDRYNNTAYQLSHYPPNILPWRVSSKTQHTVFCTFETTQPPLAWKARIERTAHSVITTSEWVKSVFIDALDLQVPIHVIPHGVEVLPWDLRQWTTCGPLRFLMVASNPFDARKNGMLAVQAFQHAFPSDVFSADEVQLVVKGFASPTWRTDDERISYMRGDFNDQALRDLYRSCHFFVSPSRGEGFCLPVFEAMSHGLIPVVTDWSAPGEALSEDYAVKIPLKGFIEVNDELPHNPYLPEIWGSEPLGLWAEPRFDALVDIFRDLIDHDGLTEMAHRAYQFAKTRITVDEMIDRTLEIVTGRISP